MNKYFLSLYNQNLSSKLDFLKKTDSDLLEKMGEKEALNLFKETSRTVRAYAKFLKQNKLESDTIKHVQDFKKLPLVSKENYIKKYDFPDLLSAEDLGKITTFSATSGSTGEPVFFPRSEEQDKYYEYISEVFLTNQFGVSKKKTTLVIIGFGLGVWIGGIFTYKNFNKLAAKGYKLSLLPVGPQKDIFLKTLKKFGHLFDQVILAAYPPFIKDVIDESTDYGINWKDYNIKILTAAESYTEEFRDYIAKKAKIKNIYTDFINIYGSVELGTMAFETPLSILIRRLARKNKDVFTAVFNDLNRQPTLVQYYPYLTYFEEVNGDLVATGSGSSIPLVRYKFADKGGVISFNEMSDRFASVGIDIIKEAAKYGIAKTILKLPFVYVYERSDSVVSLMGINIYPDYIKEAIQKSQLQGRLTGKFAMATKNKENQDQFLEINIELQKDQAASSSLAQLLKNSVISCLREKSVEYGYLYKNNSPEYRERIAPKIVLCSYEDETFFKSGIKQKWIIN